MTKGWRRRHSDAVRALEAGNQPAAGLLRQDLKLNSLARFRHVLWSLRARHRPSYVRNGHARPQKPHVNIGDRERALGKDGLEALAYFALDLRASSPPRPDHVHRIAVF